MVKPPQGEPPAAPDNGFSIRRVKVKRNGTVTLRVKVRAPGRLRALVTTKRNGRQRAFAKGEQRPQRPDGDAAREADRPRQADRPPGPRAGRCASR